jgi:hypothetical protein
MKSYVPTSVVLDDLLKGAAEDHVTLDWLLENLSERSFGIVMLLLGLLALIPGVSGVIAVLLAIPAIQMMLGRKAPIFPGFIARRRLPTQRLARLIARINPTLRRLERVIRPRWPTPFEATKRTVGFVVLLLGALILVPVPFSNIVPALVVMLLSFAYLEEDGVVLCVALVAALATLAFAGAVVWAAVRGIGWLERL